MDTPELLKQLRLVRSNGVRAGNLWNPDGPEAAARIEALEAELERAREALRPFAENMAMRKAMLAKIPWEAWEAAREAFSATGRVK